MTITQAERDWLNALWAQTLRDIEIADVMRALKKHLPKHP